MQATYDLKGCLSPAKLIRTFSSLPQKKCSAENIAFLRQTMEAMCKTVRSGFDEKSYGDVKTLWRWCSAIFAGSDRRASACLLKILYTLSFTILSGCVEQERRPSDRFNVPFQGVVTKTVTFLREPDRTIHTGRSTQLPINDLSIFSYIQVKVSPFCSTSSSSHCMLPVFSYTKLPYTVRADL